MAQLFHTVNKTEVTHLLKTKFYKIVSMRKIAFLFFIFISCSLLSQNIREGSSRYGSVLYNWDGKNLREGSSRYGSVLVNYDGKNIREGSSRYASVLCNFDGKNLREGSSRYGSVLLNVDGTDIPEPILVMLCL